MTTLHTARTLHTQMNAELAQESAAGRPATIMLTSEDAFNVASLLLNTGKNAALNHTIPQADGTAGYVSFARVSPAESFQKAMQAKGQETILFETDTDGSLKSVRILDECGVVQSMAPVLRRA